MRIIHTADWHLGQYFYTKSRAAEHQAFLHWLIIQVEQHHVDAIIVAGDIFDNGSPPSYAREMYYSFVVELQHTGCQLIILGGNHDSVATLNESRDLLACLNTRVIACASDDPAQQVLLLENRQQQPGALLCAIPYLRPRDVLTSKAGQSGDEKQLALQEAITAHYQQCYQLACQKRDELGLPLPIIATGHLTTIGVTASESVRDIYIGTLDAFPAQAFPPADYIALGHIHRPQRVTKSDHIRYSGSPIPLSFDELGSEKSVCLVSFIPDAPPKIDTLPIPVTQPMQLIKGSLSDIEQQLATFQNYQGDKPVWLDIELNTQDYLSDMQKRIQAMTEHLHVEVLLLRRTREQRLQAITRQDKETLNELSVHDVFERRLATEKDMEDGRQQRVRTLFNQVINELENSEPAK
ncbi:exonuclease subunit SbcD [Pectobacterium parmentieri]|uniref:Nuclease SbcCD subunit D n=3 Tax=Pectobacterium parmentieri TaxID=1905730 RepID=A0ABS0RWL2_PECPM|nr:exonuclease subunit SbcD [Pectobacterium parmentieri]AYH02449.1 exonuclease subunit SbcD [Pectobacterium parmentieri]AYH28714.1 exonuclease subunit SbcD [Pectobacterium parmentieri]AYH33078.1 exonuclease subunit SbcD [Pectobacterium parmentieri]MBI0469808.1 exonuclease subunit SbcD [Pectobacterium parmentieri]MBI0492278.1 exonuclease subunit SbcD [Pectobacterium parmentieri]